jgi:peptide/nickel transport system permease protein
MFDYTVRRLLIAVPTLIVISLVIFLVLSLAPNDPMAQVPMTVPPEVKEKMREALGLGQPLYIQFWKWLVQFFWIEPQVLIDYYFGTNYSLDKLRVISWQTRAPVMDTVVQRLPQTLWVVGMSYVVAIAISIPIGIYSAYKQYSIFDQAGTFITMVGYSIPPFFTGPLVIVIFAVYLEWFPSTYDTLHKVNNWDSFIIQIKQMFLPVMVLAIQGTAQISRYMRSAILDNLNQDYVRTARAKGLSESIVILVHLLRKSMIPVITLIDLN